MHDYSLEEELWDFVQQLPTFIRDHVKIADLLALHSELAAEDFENPICPSIIAVRSNGAFCFKDGEMYSRS